MKSYSVEVEKHPVAPAKCCHSATKELPTAMPPDALPAAAVGILSGFSSTGAPIVTTRDGRASASSCVAVAASDIGRRVVLVFEDGDPQRPIVVGCLGALDAAVPDGAAARPQAVPALRIDTATFAVTASEAITFECGASSLTLHRSGKIVIRGSHVVSHASGVNRIKGGSVELN